MRRLILILLIFISTLTLVSTKDITNCTRMYDSGSYNLINDFTVNNFVNTSLCFYIDKDGTTFNGNYHTIYFNLSYNQTLFVFDMFNLSDITIKNLNVVTYIKNEYEEINDTYFIFATDLNNFRLSNFSIINFTYPLIFYSTNKTNNYLSDGIIENIYIENNYSLYPMLYLNSVRNLEINNIHLNSGLFSPVYFIFESTITENHNSHINNISFENIYSKITFNHLLVDTFTKENNYSILYTTDDFILYNNFIRINPNSFPEFNQSTTVNIKNQNFIRPQIISNSNICPIDICSNISNYTIGYNNTYTFNVTNWNNFRYVFINERPRCEQVPYSDYYVYQGYIIIDSDSKYIGQYANLTAKYTYEKSNDILKEVSETTSYSLSYLGAFAGIFITVGFCITIIILFVKKVGNEKYSS